MKNTYMWNELDPGKSWFIYENGKLIASISKTFADSYVVRILLTPGIVDFPSLESAKDYLIKTVCR